MKSTEKKSLELELKDLDTSKRTAVIKHAVYTSIDKVKDISTKGMFTKSWQETTPDFLFNHKEGETVGSVKRTFEDDNGAYTEVKFGNWTLGNDVLEMASEGVLKGASFGYITEKKDFVNIKGQRVRKLKEVKHIETSLLTVLPAHPEAGIVTLTKAFNDLELKTLSQSEQDFLKSLLLNDQSNIEALVALLPKIDATSDLYTWVGWQISRRADWMADVMSQLKWNSAQIKSMKEYVGKVETFCRNTNISDESIISLQNNIQEYKQIISEYDTAITHVANEPVASDEGIKLKKLKMIELLMAS